jgi:peptide deformylase
MLTLVNDSHPALKSRTYFVKEFDDSLKDFAAAMHVTMFTNNGVGLAANQVGDKRRMFVAYDPEKMVYHTFINPKIVYTDGECEMTEGCLSFPGRSIKLKRPKKVVVKAQDSNGKFFTLEAKGVLARCILHEIDHLNGITFIDRQNGDVDEYRPPRKDNRPRQRRGKERQNGDVDEYRPPRKDNRPRQRRGKENFHKTS